MCVCARTSCSECVLCSDFVLFMVMYLCLVLRRIWMCGTNKKLCVLNFMCFSHCFFSNIIGVVDIMYSLHPKL